MPDYPAVVAEWLKWLLHSSIYGSSLDPGLNPAWDHYAITVMMVMDCVMELCFTQVSRDKGYSLKNLLCILLGIASRLTLC